MEKPVIPIMICGLSRTFPFGWGKRSKEIYENYLKFYGKLSEKYSLYFYISTDDIHLENTQRFFNKYGVVRNIYLSNTGFKLNKTEDTVNIQEYLDIYDTSKFVTSDPRWIYQGRKAIHQFHRNLDVCNLLVSDIEVCQKANVLIRTRLDTVVNDNLTDGLIRYIDEANRSSKESTFFSSDLIYCGTKDLLIYLMKGLEHNLGILNWEEPYESKAYNAMLGVCSPLISKPGTPEYFRWVSSPEGQMIALLHKYLRKIGEENYYSVAEHNYPRIVR